KETMTELVKACDLEQKVNAHTTTLSGGQKRKCQMAMMLTGGSSLCMLDEVSSGLDPLSRRKIWDIILAERGKRSMILTTHFLDEADLLSDDITILSKGQKVAGGSAVALKAQLGGGYRVRVYHEDAKPLPAEVEKIPKQVLYDQTVYQVPDSGSAAKMIKLLEGSGVQDYQVNGPTIEDVFLKLAEEVKAELQKGESDRSPSPSSDSPAVGEKGLQLVTGKNTTFFGQTWVLFRKRATILMRNVWPYLVGLL
ncbi:putative ABC transporter, partial [Hortaea werneckii]